MGGFFGVVADHDCVCDIFYGTDYHSHLGTKRGGLAVCDPENGITRRIHDITNAQFRSKFDDDIDKFAGNSGIGIISDYEDQPLIISSRFGNYAIVTVGKINNIEELAEDAFNRGFSHFSESSCGELNPTEIVAMLSGGMSFRRLMWPYFIGAFVITALSFVLNMWLIPVSQRDCVAFELKYIKTRKADQFERHIYRQIEPGTFAYVRNYNKTSQSATFFAIEEYDGNSMRRTLEASDVKFDPETKRWCGQRYIERTFDENGAETFTQYRNLDTLINLDVAELGRLNELIKTMNIVELREFMEQQREKGSDSLRQIEVEHHTRFANPIGTFILTLIGVSLSSRKVRGGTGLHIGIGIGLCFSYIMLNRVFGEFAKGGSMPALLAVWIPNIVFLAIGIYLYKKAPK